MRRFILMLLPVLLLLATSCGTSPSPGFTPDDLHLNIGGAQYRCDTDIAAVTAALGEEYAYSEGLSCAYDGLDKTYQYEAATFFTNPLEKGETVSEIYTESPAVTTSKGIAAGASREDVLAAYGEASEDTGYQLIYRLAADERGALCFDLADGVVTAIYITLEAV